jgi:hypothetical protein
MNETDSIFQRAVSKLLTEVFDGPPCTEAYIPNPCDSGLHRQSVGSINRNGLGFCDPLSYKRQTYSLKRFLRTFNPTGRIATR